MMVILVTLNTAGAIQYTVGVEVEIVFATLLATMNALRPSPCEVRGVRVRVKAQR